MKSILKEIDETKVKIEETQEIYMKLTDHLNELNIQLCKNINFEDLRYMKKEDIIIGQRVFGKNDGGFYTLVIEEVMELGDLDFKAFVADDGCRYGIFEHYILKEEV